MHTYMSAGSQELDWAADHAKAPSVKIGSLFRREFDSLGFSLGGMFLLVADGLVTINLCMYVCMYV